MNNNLATDVYIKTEHLKKKSKSKVSFSVIINKVLVSAVILTTIAGAATPAEAASITDSYKNAVSNYNSSANITQNYEVSVESAIYNVKSTIEAIEQMKSKGVVDDGILQELATQITQLERAVNLEGKEASKEVVDIVSRAESVVSGLTGKGATSAQAAIAVAKQSFSISNEIENSIKIDNAKAAATSFSDVKSSDWFYKDVMTLSGKGIISGVKAPVNGVGEYAPQGTVSLGQFLAISTRLVASDYIKDVPNAGHWATGNYAAAVESGLIQSKDFKSTPKVLDAGISREDMAYILVNIAKANGETLSIKEGIKETITDFSTISSNRQDAVLKAYSNGLIVGSNGKFNPKNNLTRAEVSAVFCRVMNYTTRPTIQQPTAPVVDNDTVITEGIYAGRMRTAKATEYHLAALKTANFYTEGGKYYVSIDLPQLPEGFKWRISIGAYTKDGNYVFATMNKDYTGVVGKQVIEVVSLYEGKTLKDIDVAVLDVVVKNEKMESMLGHSLSTKAPNQVLRQSDVDSSDASWETFNTSGVFNWK